MDHTSPEANRREGGLHPSAPDGDTIAFQYTANSLGAPDSPGTTSFQYFVPSPSPTTYSSPLRPCVDSVFSGASQSTSHMTRRLSRTFSQPSPKRPEKQQRYVCLRSTSDDAHAPRHQNGQLIEECTSSHLKKVAPTIQSQHPLEMRNKACGVFTALLQNINLSQIMPSQNTQDGVNQVAGEAGTATRSEASQSGASVVARHPDISVSSGDGSRHIDNREPGVGIEGLRFKESRALASSLGSAGQDLRHASVHRSSETDRNAFPSSTLLKVNSSSCNKPVKITNQTTSDGGACRVTSSEKGIIALPRAKVQLTSTGMASSEIAETSAKEGLDLESCRKLEDDQEGKSPMVAGLEDQLSVGNGSAQVGGRDDSASSWSLHMSLGSPVSPGHQKTGRPGSGTQPRTPPEFTTGNSMRPTSNRTKDRDGTESCPSTICLSLALDEHSFSLDEANSSSWQQIGHKMDRNLASAHSPQQNSSECRISSSSSSTCSSPWSLRALELLPISPRDKAIARFEGEEGTGILQSSEAAPGASGSWTPGNGACTPPPSAKSEASASIDNCGMVPGDGTRTVHLLGSPKTGAALEPSGREPLSATTESRCSARRKSRGDELQQKTREQTRDILRCRLQAVEAPGHHSSLPCPSSRTGPQGAKALSPKETTVGVVTRPSFCNAHSACRDERLLESVPAVEMSSALAVGSLNSVTADCAGLCEQPAGRGKQQATVALLRGGAERAVEKVAAAAAERAYTESRSPPTSQKQGEVSCIEEDRRGQRQRCAPESSCPLAVPSILGPSSAYPRAERNGLPAGSDDAAHETELRHGRIFEKGADNIEIGLGPPTAPQLRQVCVGHQTGPGQGAATVSDVPVNSSDRSQPLVDPSCSPRSVHPPLGRSFILQGVSSEATACDERISRWPSYPGHSHEKRQRTPLDTRGSNEEHFFTKGASSKGRTNWDAGIYGREDSMSYAGEEVGAAAAMIGEMAGAIASREETTMDVRRESPVKMGGDARGVGERVVGSSSEDQPTKNIKSAQPEKGPQAPQGCGDQVAFSSEDEEDCPPTDVEDEAEVGHHFSWDSPSTTPEKATMPTSCSTASPRGERDEANNVSVQKLAETNKGVTIASSACGAVASGRSGGIAEPVKPSPGGSSLLEEGNRSVVALRHSAVTEDGAASASCSRSSVVLEARAGISAGPEVGGWFSRRCRTATGAQTESADGGDSGDIGSLEARDASTLSPDILAAKISTAEGRRRRSMALGNAAATDTHHSRGGVAARGQDDARAGAEGHAVSRPTLSSVAEAYGLLPRSVSFCVAHDELVLRERANRIERSKDPGAREEHSRKLVDHENPPPIELVSNFEPAARGISSPEKEFHLADDIVETPPSSLRRKRLKARRLVETAEVTKAVTEDLRRSATPRKSACTGHEPAGEPDEAAMNPATSGKSDPAMEPAVASEQEGPSKMKRASRSDAENGAWDSIIFSASPRLAALPLRPHAMQTLTASQYRASEQSSGSDPTDGIVTRQESRETWASTAVAVVRTVRASPITTPECAEPCTEAIDQSSSPENRSRGEKHSPGNTLPVVVDPLRRQQAAELAALHRWNTARDKKSASLIAKLKMAQGKGDDTEVRKLFRELKKLRHERFVFVPSREKERPDSSATKPEGGSKPGPPPSPAPAPVRSTSSRKATVESPRVTPTSEVNSAMNRKEAEGSRAGNAAQLGDPEGVIGNGRAVLNKKGSIRPRRPCDVRPYRSDADATSHTRKPAVPAKEVPRETRKALLPCTFAGATPSSDDPTDDDLNDPVFRARAKARARAAKGNCTSIRSAIALTTGAKGKNARPLRRPDEPNPKNDEGNGWLSSRRQDWSLEVNADNVRGQSKRLSRSKSMPSVPASRAAMGVKLQADSEKSSASVNRGTPRDKRVVIEDEEWSPTGKKRRSKVLNAAECRPNQVSKRARVSVRKGQGRGNGVSQPTVDNDEHGRDNLIVTPRAGRIRSSDADKVTERHQTPPAARKMCTRRESRGRRGAEMMRQASAQPVVESRNACIPRASTGNSVFAGLSFVIEGLSQDKTRELASAVLKGGGMLLDGIPAARSPPTTELAARPATAAPASGMNTEESRRLASASMVIAVSDPSASRRPGYVLAIATGALLVHHLWVSDSLLQGKALLAAPYLLPGVRVSSRRRQAEALRAARASTSSVKQGANGSERGSTAEALVVKLTLAKAMAQPATPLNGTSVGIADPSPEVRCVWAKVLKAAGSQVVREIRFPERNRLVEGDDEEGEDSGVRRDRGSRGTGSVLRTAVKGLTYILCDYPETWHGYQDTINQTATNLAEFSEIGDGDSHYRRGNLHPATCSISQEALHLRALIDAAYRERVPVVSLSWAMDCVIRGVRVKVASCRDYVTPFEELREKYSSSAPSTSPKTPACSAGVTRCRSVSSPAIRSGVMSLKVFLHRGIRYEVGDHVLFDEGEGVESAEEDRKVSRVGRIENLERMNSGRVFVMIESLETPTTGRALRGGVAGPSADISSSKSRGKRVQELLKVASGSCWQRLEARSLLGRVTVLKPLEFDERSGYCGRDPSVYLQRTSPPRKAWSLKA